MATCRVLILRAPGTNCDLETAFAFEKAGAVTERCHINRLLEHKDLLGQVQVVCLPGGFSYGDDIAAGRILGSKIQTHLADTLAEFHNRGGVLLGICNGFQILMNSGLLLAHAPDEPPTATLAWNDRGRFEDRWVHLRVDGSQCVLLEGIERMYLPIAHAEGKFVASSTSILDELQNQGQLALRYASPTGSDISSNGEQLPYPLNPNGAQRNVAGMCDATGRIFGLMPHPERHIDPLQHPQWTRRDEQPEHGDGFAVFQNAVRYFA